MSVVFILVDALRSDYLTYHRTAPFLLECSKNGIHVEEVKPSIGFCERVEILTGVGFPKNGYFSAIGRVAHRINPYFFLRGCPGKIGEISFFRKVLRKVMRMIGITLQPYEIPFSLLPDLVLTEDGRDHRDRNAFEIESLVDVFKDCGKKISWHFAALGLHNGNDDERIQALKNSFSNNEADLYMLYIGCLDTVAHNHGPHSAEVAAALGDVDQKIGDLFGYISEKDPDSVLVVLGDHGMAKTEKIVDAEKRLKSILDELGLTPWKDFKYFLDSTTCRIWGNGNLEKEKLILKRFEEEFAGDGYWLTGVWDRGIYGDHVWICNEGVLIFPDFFHRTGSPYKGMHGYSPDSSAMKGVAVVYSGNGRIANKTIESGSLGDTANTLCDLVGVRPPKDSKGVSWV